MLRKVGFGLVGLGLGAALVWAFWPQPTPVDLAIVARGPMQGSIVGQGVTRVRAPYSVSAPITGTVTRSPVEVGDPVTAGETVVAVIRPADPALMDARARAQAEAAVAEAQAALQLAESNLRHAETGLAYAATQLERGQSLADLGTIPRRMLEDLQAAHDSAVQTLDAARSQLDMSRATLVRAQATLIGPGSGTDTVVPDACCERLLAPQTGIVLAVTDQSARLVQAGSPLLTIGDLAEMEIELDLLSTDAVRVPPDARAEVDRWGGDGVLQARLRRIDPAAFTRVSALGIEEQRVRLRLDLLSPPQDRVGLGDGFRVHVRLIIWEADDLLQVPQAALFRDGDGWAAFVSEGNRVQKRPVEIGRQAAGHAEVLGGLAEGAMVVLFPPSGMANGTTIVARN